MTIHDHIRSLMRHHAAALMVSSVTFVVRVGGRYIGSREIGGTELRYIVPCSEWVTLEKRRTMESEQPAAAAEFWIQVPSGGLPFEPAMGQHIERAGRLWPVAWVRPRTVGGVDVGYRIGVMEGRLP